jgi:hypothetical protein
LEPSFVILAGRRAGGAGRQYKKSDTTDGGRPISPADGVPDQGEPGRLRRHVEEPDSSSGNGWRSTLGEPIESRCADGGAAEPLPAEVEESVKAVEAMLKRDKR